MNDSQEKELQEGVEEVSAETQNVKTTDVETAADEQSVPDAPLPKKNHKGLIIALILLLLAGGGFAVAAFVYPGFLATEKVSVDFNELIKEPKVKGFNTVGTIGKIDYDEEKTDALLSSIEKEDNRAVVESFLESVTFTADKTKALSNDDTVTITAEYDEQLIEQLEKESKVKIEVTGATKTFTVSGLEEKPKFSAKDISGNYACDGSIFLTVYPIDDYEVLCEVSTESNYLFFTGSLDKQGKITTDISANVKYEKFAWNAYPEITGRGFTCTLEAKDGAKMFVSREGEKVYPSGTAYGSPKALKIKTVNVTQKVQLGESPYSEGSKDSLVKGDILYIPDDTLSTIGDPIGDEPQGVYYLAYSPKHEKFGWVNVRGTDL